MRLKFLILSFASSSNFLKQNKVNITTCMNKINKKMEVTGQNHFYERLRGYISQFSTEKSYQTHFGLNDIPFYYSNSNMSYSNGKFN